MPVTLSPSLRQNWLLWLAIPLALLFFVNRPSKPEFAIKSVSVVQAKSLIDQGAVVVDVRDPEKFAYRHIPGAILLPLAILRQGIPNTFTADKTKPIVVYCGDGATIGPEGTHLLSKAGYTGAVNVGPGIRGWADAGLPVKLGK